jgi:hypothetical protein
VEQQREKDLKFLMNYRRFYECPDATYETVKAAYKGHKLVKKEERKAEAPPGMLDSLNIPESMRKDPQFYDDMVRFFGNMDLAQMILGSNFAALTKSETN